MADNRTITPDAGEISHSRQPIVIFEGLELLPGSPFFEFMLTFLVSTAGLTPAYDAGNYPDFMRNTTGLYPGKITANLHANLWRAVDHVRAGQLAQQSAEISLCCMLATTAFQSIDHATVNSFKHKNNALEVLRHVRNAASHGNKWHFANSQPKVMCKWGALVIDAARLGVQHPLHDKQCFYGSSEGSISAADLLRLLRDVEQLIAPC